MVFAVRCPAARCRKYMLVEAADRGRTLPCLVCKTPVRVPTVPDGEAPTPPDDALIVSDAPAPVGLPVAKPLPPG